jgi:hypothetical protein
MNNDTVEILPEDLAIEDEFTEEYETHNEGIIRKINSVLNNRKIGSGAKETAKKKNGGALTDSVKRFRVTEKDRRVLKRLARQSGYSENEVAYYFFAFGIKKEFEKERDKFDLSVKVKRAYSEALDFELGKLREAVKAELQAATKEQSERLEQTAQSVNELRRENFENFRSYTNQRRRFKPRSYADKRCP